MRLRALLSSAVFVALAAGARPALAGDAASAEALFKEANKLFESGQTHAACEKFQASFDLDPSVGAMMNLARCHEKEGKSASAWAEFTQAETLANRLGQKDRASTAHDNVLRVEKMLRKLAVIVKFPHDGMEVTRDGSPVPKASWGSEIPVDPGDHVIEVRAPKKKSTSMKISLQAGPGVDRVEVPALEDGPPEPALPAAGAQAAPGRDGEKKSGTNVQKTIGIVTAIVGVAAVGTGAVFQILALSEDGKATDKHREADATTPPEGDTCVSNELTPTRCSAESHKDAAKGNQTTAIVFAVSGAVVLGVGLTLFFTAPSNTSASASNAQSKRTFIVPVFTGDGGGLAAIGRF